LVFGGVEMRKIITFYLFIGFFSNVWGYDALVSAVTSKSSELQIIHEGNNIDELKKNIDKDFFSIKMKSYIKLRDENGKTIDNIIAQRKFYDTLITIIKDVVNVINLSKMKIDKTSVKKVVIETIKTFDRTLKQFGITLTNDSHQKIVDTLVTVILETVDNSGKLGKSVDTGVLFYLGIGLDVAAIFNDIHATIRVNNFLFYNQVDNIATAFIHKYLDFVINKKTTITLKYFFNNYYYYNNNYYDLKSFRQKSGRLPVFGDRIVSHIKVANNLLNTYKCNSTLECITTYSHNLIAAPIYIWTDTYEDFIGVDNFKDRLQERIDTRLGQLGIHQKLLFYMTIDDNFEIDSTRGKTLTNKYIHKISDLSSVKINAITNQNQELVTYPYCGTTDDSFEHKILAQYTKVNVFYKTEECKTYNSSDDGAYNGLAISLNKKLYHLIDYFHLQKRYLNIRKEFSYHSFYGQISSLKTHGIKLNDFKTLSGNYAISPKQANTIIFSLNSYLVDQSRKHRDGTHLKHLGFSGSVTYAKLFSSIDVLLEHFYEKDYFEWEKDNIRYPDAKDNLYVKKVIKIRRRKAFMINSSDYIKYLKKLSKAGIIKLEILDVANKLYQPITVKDFVKYINLTLEF
jgi:hypothetical protein